MDLRSGGLCHRTRTLVLWSDVVIFVSFNPSRRYIHYEMAGHGNRFKALRVIGISLLAGSLFALALSVTTKV